MRNLVIAGILAAVTLPAASPALAQYQGNGGYQGDANEGRRDARDDRRGDDRRGDDRRGDDRRDYRRDARDDRQDGRGDYRRYDYNHPDPRYGGYQADRYYRAGGNYRPRRLAANDRIYRGSDNRYYCRRDDGTTGLIIGGLAGGVLGNVIAPGGSKTLGTILGGGGGALLGRSVDRNNVTCR
jgi:hypothetical protein